MTIRTKADIEYHSEGFGDAKPAVNVKVYGDWRRVKLPLDLGSVSRDGGQTFQPIVSDPGFTVDWIEENISLEMGDMYWQFALEISWEDLQMAAEEIYGASVKVYSEGRSGGWAYIDGIDWDVESWDAIALGKWRRFAKAARAIADDVPYRFVDLLYANVWEARAEEDANRANAALIGIPTIESEG